MKIHETQTTSDNQQTQQSEVQSFNSVTDHYHKIMGVPAKGADLNSLPKPLRWFGYFFYTAFSLGAIAFIIIYLIQK